MTQGQAFSDRIIAAGVVELTGLYALDLVSPIEAARAYLARIAQFNPRLNAFLDLDEDRALADAQASAARWARGEPRSLLDGVPFGVKANIAVSGLPWHGGVGAYRERRATADADCVAGLRQAGAVILGTLNMHEAALGATSDNLAFGRCENPYRQGFTPGGSSGGSAAAVAAGLCAAALGTDTLGSVRIPAAYCGGFGLMPRRDAISKGGVMPLSTTLDAIGLHARSVRDVEACAQAMGVFDGERRSPENPVRCGLLDLQPQVKLDGEVSVAFAGLASSAAAAGFDVRRLALADWEVAMARRTALVVVEVEAVAEHAVQLAASPEGFSPGLRAMLEWAAALSPEKIQAAYRRLEGLALELAAALSEVDAVLTPAVPAPAFAFSAPGEAEAGDFTLLANLLGWPALAFPLGLGSQGLPLSGQVIARSEATCLDVAARLAKSPPPPRDFS
jgi:aspartyl-tRNA(Asn)/glutamyl-tRNA(Gln) amidotransferase subunit A